MEWIVRYFNGEVSDLERILSKFKIRTSFKPGDTWLTLPKGVLINGKEDEKREGDIVLTQNKNFVEPDKFLSQSLIGRALIILFNDLGYTCDWKTFPLWEASAEPKYRYDSKLGWLLEMGRMSYVVPWEVLFTAASGACLTGALGGHCAGVDPVEFYEFITGREPDVLKIRDLWLASVDCLVETEDYLLALLAGLGVVTVTGDRIRVFSANKQLLESLPQTCSMVNVNRPSWCEIEGTVKTG